MVEPEKEKHLSESSYHSADAPAEAEAQAPSENLAKYPIENTGDNPQEPLGNAPAEEMPLLVHEEIGHQATAQIPALASLATKDPTRGGGIKAEPPVGRMPKMFTQQSLELERYEGALLEVAKKFMRRVQILAVAELLISGIILSLGTVVAYYSYELWLSPIGYEASPLWASSIALLNAIAGLLFATYPDRRRFLSAHAVLSVLSAILLFACFQISTIWAYAAAKDERVREPHRFPEHASMIGFRKARITLHALIAFFAALGTATCIASSLFVCFVLTRCVWESKATELGEQLEVLGKRKRRARAASPVPTLMQRLERFFAPYGPRPRHVQQPVVLAYDDKAGTFSSRMTKNGRRLSLPH